MKVRKKKITRNLVAAILRKFLRVSKFPSRDFGKIGNEF